MKFYLYLSDILYLLFCMFSMYWVWKSAHNTANQKVWNKIFQQETAVISASILVFFVLISMLDSIHIYKGYSMTLLDLLFSPLNIVMEYSYSRPFSATSFIPKVIHGVSGYQQVYPHLSYVPEALKNTYDVSRWLIKIALTLSLYYWGVCFFLWVIFKSKWEKLYRPYRISMITIGVMIWIILFLYLLSRSIHVFGTGQIGQDIFYQAVKSIRTGLFISSMTTIIILPFSLILGLSAGYFGGLVDDIIQFIYTVISSIPSVLLISAALLSWQLFQEMYYPKWSMMKQADVRLLVICVLLGLTNWASLCRYIRAEVFKLREMNYVKAARLLGSSSSFILRQHLLPNVMHMVIITVILDFSYYILAESVLTYVGIGVSPSTMSWGNMINAARLELARTPVVWWPLVTAFGFMFSVVLVCNLLADAVRKALNPKEEIITQKT